MPDLEQNIIYYHPHVNHDHIKNANDIHREINLASINKKIAVFFTKYFGSMGMFYTLVLWMIIWMTFATLGIWIFRYDQYPFPFLLFCSNLIQLWALPVLAVGQNVLSKHQETQAQTTYDNTITMLQQEKYQIEHLNQQDKELLHQTQMLQAMQEQMQLSLQFLGHQINDIKSQQEILLIRDAEKNNGIEEHLKAIKRPRRSKSSAEES